MEQALGASVALWGEEGSGDVAEGACCGGGVGCAQG